jgi:hypothetical protein
MNEPFYAKWLLDPSVRDMVIEGYIKSFNWSDITSNGSVASFELCIVPLQIDSVRMDKVYKETVGSAHPKKVLVIVLDE